MRYITKKEIEGYSLAALIDNTPEGAKEKAKETEKYYRNLFLKSWREESEKKRNRQNIGPRK